MVNVGSDKSFHENVKSVKAYLEKEPSHKLYDISKKLMQEDPELISMWRSLQRNAPNLDDDWWVWSFLESSFSASKLPEFHYMSLKDREDLVEQIRRDTARLVRNLKNQDLDVNLIYNEGKAFNGFFFYEDFDYSNQMYIDDSGTHKQSFVDLLVELSERSTKIIEEDPEPGKASKNVRAIKFVRSLAARNNRLYKTPLNSVLATAVNTLYQTSYNESDIRKLLSR